MSTASTCNSIQLVCLSHNNLNKQLALLVSFSIETIASQFYKGAKIKTKTIVSYSNDRY